MPIIINTGGPDAELSGPNGESRYATVQALIDRFGLTEMIQISNHETPQADTVNDTVVFRAVDDASAEIDTYLGRYRLPLASVPRVLLNVCCDITRYRLYDNRATDQVTRRYEDAVKLLGKLASGAIGLGLDSALTATVPTDGGPSAESAGRVFTRDSLADY